MTSALTGKARAFLDLHMKGSPLLQPNAFDLGSARILETLGFAAIATTSSGFAATLGRPDGHATRDEVLAHSRAIAGAVEIPVAADTENGYADSPEDVAATVRFLITGSDFVTGQVIAVDGGRVRGTP